MAVLVPGILAEAEKAMDDIKLAMLGDHEAARRLTEKGVLVPCPFCGGAVNLRRTSTGYRTNPVVILDKWTVECPSGCCQVKTFESEIYQESDGDIVIKHNGADEARLAWNTRAPILSAEEMERLEGK